jgi:hypothetical protein
MTIRRAVPFPTSYIIKDLSYAIALAEEAGLDLAQAATDQAPHGANRGGGLSRQLLHRGDPHHAEEVRSARHIARPVDPEPRRSSIR